MTLPRFKCYGEPNIYVATTDTQLRRVNPPMMQLGPDLLLSTLLAEGEEIVEWKAAKAIIDELNKEVTFLGRENGYWRWRNALPADTKDIPSRDMYMLIKYGKQD